MPEEDQDEPPLLDWRGSRVTVGCRVLYSRDGIRRIGRVTAMDRRDARYLPVRDQYTLRVRWQEEASYGWTRDPGVMAKIREGRGILLDNITVWPDVPCQHRLGAVS